MSGFRCESDFKPYKVLRFGNRTLFYEYFPEGRTRFGSMPMTGFIFPHAGYVLQSAFIKFAYLLLKQRKAKIIDSLFLREIRRQIELKLKLKKRKQLEVENNLRVQIKRLQLFR